MRVKKKPHTVRVAALAAALPLISSPFAAAMPAVSPAAANQPARQAVPSPTGDIANGDYGAYYTWPEIKNKIAEWQRNHPELVYVGSLGKTLEQRDIPLLRLSDDKTVKSGEPEVLLMAGIHPREQQPQVCLIRLIEELLDGYGKDARLTRLLRERQIWIIPILNVDGKVYDMQHGNGSNRGADWRKNRRPLSGGEFGVDLNRNFPVRWGGNPAPDPLWKITTNDPRSKFYEGPAPLSEPETQALTRFILSRPALRAFLDLHSPLRAIYHPAYLTQPEYERFHHLVAGMHTRQQDHPYEITAGKPDAEPKPGVRSGNTGLTYHWAYYTRGIYSLNFEIGTPGRYEPEPGVTEQNTQDERYPPVEGILREYADNVREPLLFFLEAAGDLPPAHLKDRPAPSLHFRTSSAPTPGAEITLTPAITGAGAWAVLVSESPDVRVTSEYRRVPIQTGFSLQIAPGAKPGASVPLTLYLWDKHRTRSTARLNLTIARRHGEYAGRIEKKDRTHP